MSWDVWLAIDTGLEEASVTEDHNYTWNVSRMYDKAFSRTLDGDGGLSTLAGMKADLAGTLIDRVLHEMEANASVYQAMNPANGWGSFDGAMEFLRKIRRDCLAHPACVVRVE